jgi:hypothetical protein
LILSSTVHQEISFVNRPPTPVDAPRVHARHSKADTRLLQGWLFEDLDSIVAVMTKDYLVLGAWVVGTAPSREAGVLGGEPC